MSLSEHENALLLQYKDLIRDQDKKLHDLQKAFNSSQRERDMLKVRIGEYNNFIWFFKIKNTAYVLRRYSNVPRFLIECCLGSR